jgi:hypothetical protein
VRVGLWDLEEILVCQVAGVVPYSAGCATLFKNHYFAKRFFSAQVSDFVSDCSKDLSLDLRLYFAAMTPDGPPPITAIVLALKVTLSKAMKMNALRSIWMGYDITNGLHRSSRKIQAM